MKQQATSGLNDMLGTIFMLKHTADVNNLV